MAATRRQFLQWVGYGIGAAALPLTLPSMARAQVPARKLVVLALRGGVDGLHLVPPVGTGVTAGFLQQYQDERPTLRFDPSNPEPGRATLPIPNCDHFHLHPQLGFFADVLQNQPNGLNMAILHGVGGTGTRSHFDSLDAWEWAKPYGSGIGSFNGWLHDTLARIYPDTSEHLSSLNAAAIQSSLPRSLGFVGNEIVRGTPVPDFSDFVLHDPNRRSLLDALYVNEGRHDAIATAAANALNVVDTVAGLDTVPSSGEGSFGMLYPGKDSLYRRFHTIARLIRSGPANLSVFTLDYSADWDTHDDQIGVLDGGSGIETLALGLKHFYEELEYYHQQEPPGISPNDVCTVIFSDFGRTVDENANGGTDHGNGNVVFVLGGGLTSSRVIHTDWDFENFAANLESTSDGAPTLNGVGNPRTELKALIDFRQVYRDVLANVFGFDTSDFDVIFGESVASAGIWG